jgi:RND family efflux transporter MFP subunit
MEEDLSSRSLSNAMVQNIVVGQSFSGENGTMKVCQLLLAAFSLIALVTPVATQETDRPVKLGILSAKANEQVRQFFGQIAARQTVDLAFQVSGQIRDFPVVEGAPLAKGDLIARLDLEPFELSLEQARLQSEQADRTVERLQKLSSNAVSQVTVEDAITAARLAAISVRNAEYAMEHASLFAPFDGIVASRNVANFTTITAGTPVARIHDMSELSVEIDVPEVLFRQVGEDPNLEIYATFPGDDVRYTLEVREFNAEASKVGQTFRLTLAMDLPENARVLPGSSVTVVGKLISDGTTISIPASALVVDAGDSLFVMLFEPTGAEAGTIRKVTVEVEPNREGGFDLLSGVESGSEIVVAGAASLEDGQSVRRFVGFSN